MNPHLFIMLTMLAMMAMANLRESMKSTRVVEVAVSGKGNNFLPNKLCVLQVGKQAVVVVIEVKSKLFVIGNCESTW